MELTKKEIMKRENIGATGAGAMSLIWGALGVAGLVLLVRAGDFSGGALIGMVIAAVILIFAILLFVHNLRQQKSIREVLIVPWEYNIFECTRTELETSVSGENESFYVDFTDADGKTYRIDDGYLRDKISAGDKLIMVTAPHSDFPGVWYFSSQEYKVSDNNNEFAYNPALAPLKP